jgi:hypothetical protein
MPNIVIPLSDIAQSVERPVIFDIIRQVMLLTRISYQTPIRFYGDEGKSAQQNSTLTKDPLSENKYAYNEAVAIEVAEDFEVDRLSSTMVKYPENYLIFSDDKLGVYIKPVYSSTEVTITIKYRSVDKNQANKWRNDIRTRWSMMRDINLHEINYSYHFPEEYFLILQELHRLRENVSGYGDTFQDYFSKNLSPRATLMTNLSGKQSLWAIAERQIRIQGIFGFETVPEKPEKDDEHDVWVTQIDYKFKYDKPIECNMVYPIMIHNQLLSSKYRVTESVTSFNDKHLSFTKSAGYFNDFESTNDILNINGNKGLDIPHFDNFYPNSVPSATVRVFTVLTSITPSNRKSLFNLADLGEFDLNSKIIDFLKAGEYAFITKTYASIFCLNLYEDSFLRASDSLIVDANLNVSSALDLDLRRTYRVRLGLVADFDLLPKLALARVKKDYNVSVQLTKSINSSLRELGNQQYFNKNILSDSDFRHVGLKSDGTYEPRERLSTDDSLSSIDSSNRLQWNLVQNLFVASRRMNDYSVDINNNHFTKTD